MGSTAVSTADSAPNARELLAEFKATGDQAAFEEIVRRYAGMVFGVCLRTTKNPHDAEDATQAVFLSLAVQCKTGDGVKFVGPWLQQVAKRVSLDIKRSRKRREAREQRHHAMNGNGNGHTEVEKAGAVDVDELKGVLGEELNALPSKYRLPLILHYFGGMTRDQMAQELNCKPATLGVRIHRAREMLGRRLHERGAAPPGLVLSALVAGSVQQQICDAMVARTVEAACKLSLGQDLGVTIAGNVLAIAKSAAAGAALAAKLKTVAAILLVAALTACAGGAVAKLAPLVELQLPEILNRNWLPKFQLRSPLPSFSAATEKPEKAAAGAAPAPAQVAQVVTVPVEVPTGPTAGAGQVAQAVPAGPAQGAPAKAQPAVAANARASAAPFNPPADIHSADRLRGATAWVPNPASLAREGAPSSVGTTGGTSGSVEHAGSVTVATTDSMTPITAEAGEEPVSTPGATYLSVASAAGSSGWVGLRGANVAYDQQDVGYAGDGTVDQVGGTNTFGQLRLGVRPGSRGTYNVRGGGTLAARRGGAEGVNGIQVGGEGEGNLNIGDAASGGNVVAVGDAIPGQAEPSLVVRADPDGSGKVHGWGTVNLPGTFDNNGWTIADGFGNGRSLDFEGFKQVVNSIENPPVGGTHGWYARDGARLALPHLRVAAGTGTYTWGESTTDDVIDLVNSARVTLYDVPDDGVLRISLMALDRGGVPPLPRGHTAIGIWQMEMLGLAVDPVTGLLDSSPMEPAGIDLAVRYDDTLAAGLGLDENQLKLWKFQDGRWTRIVEGFERHPDTNILTGHTAGGIEYYAVTAPEPGSIGLLLLAGGFTLCRRKRRDR